MLTHFQPGSAKPSRVVVLGAAGFIGGAILRRLVEDGIRVVGLGRAELDLVQSGAAARMNEIIRAGDAVVFASARAPCKDLAMLRENLVMAETVCAVLRASPVAHVVYLSSDAVYKDSQQPLSEESCAEPSSLHGAMHLTREIALQQAFPGPLAVVRPTLVYGLDDPHNGYGPNRFRRAAAAGQDILLFGEGEERRDHVDVQDIAELVRLVLLYRSAGVVNAVSGEIVSFRELAEFAASEFEPHVNVTTTPRTGPMPHNGYRAFANGAVQQAFPGMRFRSWHDGLSLVHAQQRLQGGV